MFRIRSSAALLSCMLLAFAGQLQAQNPMVPAPNAVDMVHDTLRDIVYVSSSDGTLLRYDVGGAAFLAPVVLGGQPGGMDLSPDGTQLAVADRVGEGTSLRILLVNLETLAVRKLLLPKVGGHEGGVFTVAYAANGDILATPRAVASGDLQLRRVSPFTRKVRRQGSILFNTMLKASADRLTVAFAEPGISSGPWGLFDLPTRRVVRRDGFQGGTSWFNYEIAVDSIGGQFAIPTYGGTFIYDADYQRVATIGQYAAGQPVGVVYDPTRLRAYFPWAESTQVRVYDMRNFQQVGAYETGYTFTSPGNTGFQPGRIRISDDGSLLLVRVGGGVQLIAITARSVGGRPASKAPSRR